MATDKSSSMKLTVDDGLFDRQDLERNKTNQTQTWMVFIVYRNDGNFIICINVHIN